MSENKSYQIVMGVGCHYSLKSRAKLCGMKIGDLVENLFAGYELRLSRWFKVANFKNPDRQAQKAGIFLLLKADSEGWPSDKIENEFRRLRIDQTTQGDPTPLWVPRVKV